MHSPDSDSIDRRPLGSRSWPAVRRLAGTLARNGVAPNAVSVAGMVFGVAAGVLLAITGCVDDPSGSGWAARMSLIGAAVCIQLRLLCNLLDGLVAVEGGRRSAAGSVYNELPDRVSDVATLVGAGYAAASVPELGYAAAIVALVVAYVRELGKACGCAYDFRGPMAKQHRMAVITVACLVAAVRPGAWANVAMGGRMIEVGPLSVGLALIVLGGVVTAARRTWRLLATLGSTPQ